MYRCCSIVDRFRYRSNSVQVRATQWRKVRSEVNAVNVTQSEITASRTLKISNGASKASITNGKSISRSNLSLLPSWPLHLPELSVSGPHRPVETLRPGRHHLSRRSPPSHWPDSARQAITDHTHRPEILYKDLACPAAFRLFFFSP